MSKRRGHPHNQHDHSYKDLFSHPEMVRDLFRGFVKPEWLDEIDDSSWEKVNASFNTAGFREKSDDVVWKVLWKGQWIWLYIIFEFQSTIPYYMPVRINAYASLLWEDLIKSERAPMKGPMPPVLPIVLYNGEKRWDAPLDLQSMVLPGPRGLERYRPQIRYLLIDEGSYSDCELKPMRNLVAALFRIENSRNKQEIDEVLKTLCEWLAAPEHTSLRRAFASWIGRVIMRRLPGGAVEGVYELQEMRVMLSERFDEWAEGFKREGRQEGEVNMLQRLIVKRFGIVPEWVVSRLQQAERQQLEAWGERLFDINNLEELFEGEEQSGR